MEYASRRAPVEAPWRTASSRALQKLYNEESAAPKRLFCLCTMSCVTGEFAKGRLSLEPIEPDLQRDIRADPLESWQGIH